MIFDLWFSILKYVLNGRTLTFMVGLLTGMYVAVSSDLKYHLEKRKKRCKNCVHCQNVGSADYCSFHERVLRADESRNCADFGNINE